MANFRGKRVSTSWGIVLRSAERAGVKFTLNSGRRTKSEQLALIREKGVWSPSNPTGAAAYSPTAPHIRVGREDHALDVNNDGGHLRLAAWLAKQGVASTFKIPQEPWHLEVNSEGALIALAKRLKLPSKRERLTLELARIRSTVRRLGRWTPKRQRRAKSIEKYLRRR